MKAPTLKVPVTRNQADELLRRKCEIRVAMSKITDEMNHRIIVAKDRAKANAATYFDEESAINVALEAWFEEERKNLGKYKSLKLIFGTIGTRASKSIRWMRGFSAERVVLEIRRAFANDDNSFLRIREEPNKEAIAAACEEDREILRSRCGVKFAEQETFYIEPDLDALQSKQEVTQ